MSRRLVQALAPVLVLALAACSSPVKLDETAAVPVEDRSGGAVPPSSAGTGGVTQVDATRRGLDPLDDPRGVLAQRSIFFDFDSYAVRDDFRPLVEAHARYLAANRQRSIVIEGHTDDRGGNEYNLALGQRRSEAVRRMMLLLGVQDNQIEAVSFGKTKPKAAGQDEASHAQNRRADIVYR